MRTVALAAVATAVAAQCVMPDKRPAPGNRKFISAAVDGVISSLRPRFIDANLGTLFSNTLPNTVRAVHSRDCPLDASVRDTRSRVPLLAALPLPQLDTTVYSHTPNNDTFIVTG
jgi:hypothetical protein